MSLLPEHDKIIQSEQHLINKYEHIINSKVVKLWERSEFEQTSTASVQLLRL